MAIKAYCAQSDVEAKAGMTFGVSSRPTATQVESFINERGGEIYNVLRQSSGREDVGGTGYASVIDTSTDEGYALEQYASMLNGIAAAMDALLAAGAGDSPAMSQRVQELSSAYEGGIARIKDMAQAYSGLGTASTHLSTGRVQPLPGTPAVVSESGPVFSGTTEF